MSQQFPLGTMLTKIRNGQKARQRQIATTNTLLCQRVLDVFLQEGIISSYSMSSHEIYVELKYNNNDPVIGKLSCVSRPGCRRYIDVNDLWDVEKGLGFLVLSTPKGVLSDKEARALHVGGEVLCRVV